METKQATSEESKRLIDANILVEKFLSLTLTVTGLRAGKGVILELLNKYRNGILQLINEQPTVDGGAVCVKLQPVEDYPCIPDPYEELGTAWAEFKTAMWNEFSESKPGKLFIRAADKFAAFLERRFHG